MRRTSTGTNTISQPAKALKHGVAPDKGCPHDCGLCTEHEQHTCVALVEITSGCNLKCPLCFAESGPGGTHISFESFTGMVDRLVELEGIADVLQISGGEPTAAPRPREDGGLRLRPADSGRDDQHQWHPPGEGSGVTDGVGQVTATGLENLLAVSMASIPATHIALRGEDLVAIKQQAIANFAEFSLRCTLVCTVAHDVNIQEVGAVLAFGVKTKAVRGLSFQTRFLLWSGTLQTGGLGTTNHTAGLGECPQPRRRTC